MKPRFTLGILYLFAFFFLYCFLLVAPALWEVLQTTPVGPEQEEVAARVAKEAIQPHLWIAFVAAVATVALGMGRGVLPGTRP
jgi:ABC-type sulfate transport system permease component